MIATYALCGFANFSSIAIQIGGIGALAPDAQIGSGAAGTARGGGGIDGEFHVGVHRGNAAVMLQQAEAVHRGAVPALRPSIGRGARQRTGRVSPTSLTNASRSRTPRSPAGRASTAVGHAGKLVFGKLGGAAMSP